MHINRQLKFLDLQVIHLAHHPIMDVFDKLQNLQKSKVELFLWSLKI